MSRLVRPATKPAAEYVPWDPAYREVVSALRAEAAPLPPWLELEHVGSTAIPGCGGKGVIDLLALYDAGHLEAAKAWLLERGFGRQGPEFRRAWPETRPMFLGWYARAGREFLCYVHVVARDHDEVRRFRAFRDRLRSDVALTAEYSRFKQQIIAEGCLDTDDYALAKREIMQRILGPEWDLR